MEQARQTSTPLVLVVDDDPRVRELGADILEDAGFQVLQAADADEALKVLSAHPDISVVFSDVEMPGRLDGLALAYRVSELCPGIGIVLASGGRVIDPSKLPREGIFVRKPYSAPALLRRIAEAMNGHDCATTAPRAVTA